MKRAAQDQGSGATAADDWLGSLLRCPCALHHSLRIDRTRELLVCANQDCPLGRGTFPIIDGQAVLVDFTTSVLDEAATIARTAPSLVPRSSGWRRRLSRRIFGGKPRARRNAARFLELVKPAGRDALVLIIGGATVGAGAAPLYEARGVRLVVFDIYRSPQTHFVADAHGIPLADGAVDGVWVQAVLEHVLSPETVVGEIHRVLREDGLVYAETPFMQQVHEGPYDFTRFTESGHRWLFRRFERIASGAMRGPFTALLWSIRYALIGLLRSRRAATALCLFLFWLRYFDRLVPPAYALDAASDVYFLGRKADTALNPKDIVRSYAGAQNKSSGAAV